ncbi:(Lipo)protein [Seminavis robusta]|uniref:(Lipo)protein n=1 Tax=Seminavis robusta TaxID=568900 RepID=A0A9N8DMT8_9STRA|nr:(Lipo)protein [Seminavis robusta]|eukprot:Sro220_g090840.1 (Lipo)protein (846) ;mRNA; f:84466-88326
MATEKETEDLRLQRTGEPSLQGSVPLGNDDPSPQGKQQKGLRLPQHPTDAANMARVVPLVTGGLCHNGNGRRADTRAHAQDMEEGKEEENIAIPSLEENIVIPSEEDQQRQENSEGHLQEDKVQEPDNDSIGTDDNRQDSTGNAHTGDRESVPGAVPSGNDAPSPQGKQQKGLRRPQQPTHAANTSRMTPLVKGGLRRNGNGRRANARATPVQEGQPSGDIEEGKRQEEDVLNVTSNEYRQEIFHGEEKQQPEDDVDIASGQEDRGFNNDEGNPHLAVAYLVDEEDDGEKKDEDESKDDDDKVEIVVAAPVRQSYFWRAVAILALMLAILAIVLGVLLSPGAKIQIHSPQLLQTRRLNPQWHQQVLPPWVQRLLQCRHQIRQCCPVQFQAKVLHFQVCPHKVASGGSNFSSSLSNSGRHLHPHFILLAVNSFAELKAAVDSGLYSFEESQYGAIELWDISRVLSLQGLFLDKENFNEDISSWDTSGVTSLYETFKGAISFNGDVSSWDTSQVTTMYSTFYGATSFNGNISAWVISSVTDLQGCFNQVTSFNGDIGSWDTSAVADITATFKSSYFNGDVSSWDTRSVTSLRQTFSYATFFNGDLSSWNTTSVTSLLNAFTGATSFNRNLSSWDTSKVSNLHQTFNGATSFNGDLSRWDTSRITTMYETFKGATSFNGDLSSWDTSSVGSFIGCFNRANSFNGDISSWDVSAVTSMDAMFKLSWFNGDISSWDTSRARNFGQVFYGAAFDGDLSAWNTSSVTTMEGTFFGATSFNGDLSNWDVASVVNFHSMFEGASSFENDLCAWGTKIRGTPRVTNMFTRTSCPEEATGTDLGATPRGPFCHFCP